MRNDLAHRRGLRAIEPSGLATRRTLDFETGGLYGIVRLAAGSFVRGDDGTGERQELAAQPFTNVSVELGTKETSKGW